jgi:hypothetical protein
MLKSFVNERTICYILTLGDYLSFNESPLLWLKLHVPLMYPSTIPPLTEYSSDEFLKYLNEAMKIYDTETMVKHIMVCNSSNSEQDIVCYLPQPTTLEGLFEVYLKAGKECIDKLARLG